MERYIKYTSIVYYIMLVIESAIALWLYIKRLFIKKFRINYKIPVGYTIESGSLEIDTSLPDNIVIIKSGKDLERELGEASQLANCMRVIHKDKVECLVGYGVHDEQST